MSRLSTSIGQGRSVRDPRFRPKTTRDLTRQKKKTIASFDDRAPFFSTPGTPEFQERDFTEALQPPAQPLQSEVAQPFALDPAEQALQDFLNIPAVLDVAAAARPFGFPNTAEGARRSFQSLQEPAQAALDAGEGDPRGVQPLIDTREAEAERRFRAIQFDPQVEQLGSNTTINALRQQGVQAAPVLRGVDVAGNVPLGPDVSVPGGQAALARAQEERARLARNELELTEAFEERASDPNIRASVDAALAGNLAPLLASSPGGRLKTTTQLLKERDSAEGTDVAGDITRRRAARKEKLAQGRERVTARKTGTLTAAERQERLAPFREQLEAQKGQALAQAIAQSQQPVTPELITQLRGAIFGDAAVGAPAGGPRGQVRQLVRQGETSEAFASSLTATQQNEFAEAFDDSEALAEWAFNQNDPAIEEEVDRIIKSRGRFSETTLTDPTGTPGSSMDLFSPNPNTAALARNRMGLRVAKSVLGQ